MLVLFISTRLVLTVIGVISRLLIKPILGYPLTTYSPNLLLDLWGVWDTRWYLDIARNGYSTRVIGPTGETNTAFFPLYPLLARILGWVVRDPFVAGLIISNLCLLIAAVVLYRLVALDREAEVASASVKYLFLFPSAFILSGFYSESLFLMLLLLSFYCARRNRWFLAGVCGFFLALTRPVGIAVIVPLALLALERAGWRRRGVRAEVAALLLIPLGTALFALYLYQVTGRFLDFVQVPGSWGRYLSNPFIVLARGVAMGGNPQVVFGAAFGLLCLLILWGSGRWIGWSYGVLGTLLLLTPLASGMIPLRGMTRYALPVFPLYLILAEGGTRNRYVDQALTATLALLQGFLMVFWTNRSLLVI